MKRGDIRVAVLRMEGTNCEEEMARAWRSAGARAEFLHLKELESGKRSLDEFHALAFPGGFSAGDYVRAGAVMAARMRALAPDLKRFVEAGKAVLGVCNGFQVMVELGLLPGDGTPGEPRATLAVNASGRFECRPTLVRPEGGSDFTRGLPRRPLEMPVAHGEGRLLFDRPATLREVEEGRLVAFRYAWRGRGEPPYPWNPSGTTRAIAGLRNPAGNVVGLMPHPERVAEPWLHGDWTWGGRRAGDGGALFASAVGALARRL
jgi:phosphoribosylformylglycinamidine synthase